MKEMFDKFMEDEEAWDMYVTGRAGTGKTTKLAELIEGLDNYTVCAYTHKACGILRDKLPEGAKVQTLHSFLKKRPTINTTATKLKNVDMNVVMGESERLHVMFIDEYSMIGEGDLMDIRALQDEDYDGRPGVKVVWIGDPHQLPPVGDMFTLTPHGDYQMTLTKVYRQAEDNPLVEPLNQIISFIEGAPPCKLIESDNFVRGVDIANPSMERPADSVILAYTNRRVQELNAKLEGKEEPEANDLVFSPTTKHSYQIHGLDETIDLGSEGIDLPHNDKVLSWNTKYKTLEYLVTMDNIGFASLISGEGDYEYYAYMFGHGDYQDTLKYLKSEAAHSNAAIEKEFPGYKAAGWAKVNYSHPLARARAKAWRDYLTFKECVICLDFSHAMTVHKSQGSTYDTVYLDTKDIGQVADRDYEMYLKLMYVGMSRASNKVVTN
jgi:exodeoxyribonuclease V